MKNALKFKIFVVLFAAITLKCLAQTNAFVAIENKEWRLYESMAIEADPLSSFSIAPTEVDDFPKWGHFITFSENTFNTHYAAPCGLDCFTRIKGHYRWLEEDQIELTVVEIRRSELCTKTSEHALSRTFRYRIEKSSTGYNFIRI